ncbi:MAG: putative DNA binding domain-containing protein [Desulfovibrio sp.]|uniref:RNA-binding domain-containing protein n=1 Tax=Desulfovibrio sp. TaxID=885 RepID=UPI0025C5FE72|nr:RNA-binding domain-containing protein [Desulfovibrio sp.]MBS6828682.1 putative DNA binding domain-containing protein [Desulfovibrio sp.]
MDASALLAQVARGEDSTRQFKADIHNAESLASEMAAFANSEGGTLFLGVADDGSVPGLSRADVSRINQLISNAASQLVRSPLTVHTENVVLENGNVVIVLTVPKGMDKPYFDKNGVIWLKTGSDKRRVNSKEELRRLFQISNQFHADELPTKAGIDKLDKLRFRDFLRDVYQQDYPESLEDLTRLLQNMNLATDAGKLNLAGVLMFAERPEWIVPQFVVKAIRYPGNAIHATDYIDTEDFAGPLRKIFDDAHAFIMRNLHKIQAGRGVNSPGQPEIPPGVFEELLVNALVHRDYLVSAAIRIFIFDDRIEIISPGHLPNNLTVEKIKAGNSNIRNPILVSYVAKGLLPYHGLGSGIKRALAEWPDIDFIDDNEGCLFKAIVRRKAVSTDTLVTDSPKKESVSPKMASMLSPDINAAIMDMIRQDSTVTSEIIAKSLNVSKRTILRRLEELKGQGVVRRIGPNKGGSWEVVE